jgi:hypothetical protein
VGVGVGGVGGVGSFINIFLLLDYWFPRKMESRVAVLRVMVKRKRL